MTQTTTASTLGARCAETLLRRIGELSIKSSNRHVIDYLPREAATALFETLVARADLELTVPIPDDGNHLSVVCLNAIRLPRADLIPFFVEELGTPAASSSQRNRGTEGFASCLRDHYSVGAEQARYLLTITPQGNETQKSAQDATADKVLVDLGLLLNGVLDDRGIAPDAPLRRVAEVYLAFRDRADSWSDVHARWERYVAEAAALSPAEQGARLPRLGCFLPDDSAEFASTSADRRVRILPESEDQKRRRSGDPLSNSRLYDNAVLRGYLGDVFANPIHDPEHVLSEVFEEAQEKAQAILKGGPSGLEHLDLNTFSGMDQIQKRREKNAFPMDRVVVEGALQWLPFEQADMRFLVVAADGPVRIRLGLKRPFNLRKEHAQIATWRADKKRLEPREVRVSENAMEVVFDVAAPAAGDFAVYRLALARGPRSLPRPIDALLIAISGATTPELLVEEDRQLSLEDQAWIAEEDPRFVRYVLTSDPEPLSVTSSEEIGESPTIEGVQIVRVTFAESSQRPLVVGRRPDAPDETDDTGSFEHEKLLELAAYTVKIGERARVAFRAAECYLDTIRHIDEAGSRWRVDMHGGSSREIFASRQDCPDPFLYEQAVARFLLSPETITLRWARDSGFQTTSTIEGVFDRGGRFFDARRAAFEAIRELAMKHVPRFRRSLSDAGVPLWLLPLHQIAPQVDAYLDAWSLAVDEAFSAKRYEAVHDRLLQLDTLLLDDAAGIQRLVLLPTNPWLLASLRRYQVILAENFRAKAKRLPLRREEVEQLVPKTALEDWYIAQRGGTRLRLTDSAPFHLEFLPEDQHRSRGTLDYVERVIANKVERYLRMHPHLRNDRRTLRIGFVNPGDGQHLLDGIRQWLVNLMRERSERLRQLPSEEIPSVDIFLFSTRGDDNEVGSAFEQFFRQKVAAADEDVVQQMMVARLRYRKSAATGPKSQTDAVHICFVHALVDAKNQSNKTGPLDEWWDGGFGDGLLATYLRRSMPGASGQLHSRRGLWLDPSSTGLRGALARLVALQRGCRDSDLERSKAIYWECPLPDVESLRDVYHNSDWVIHLDRELSLDLFTRDRRADRPIIIEYSDQEVPNSPGYDTITVTRYADPYREQLGEILTTVALDVRNRGDAALNAAHEILDDINVLSGSWALDFLMGSIAGKRYSLRLKGNVGAALAYRWIKRVERTAYGGTVQETNVGPVVPILVSLEELLRVTPAAGLSRKEGLVHRYTNEYEEKDKDKDKDSPTKFCDDLLVLYVTASQAGAPSRIYGRIIEVKFGTTAVAMADKAVLQVRNTHDLLQRHLSGRPAGMGTAVEAPFRHKQLSLLLKAQLEQAVAMGVLQAEVYSFLNVPVLSANLAVGNYEVDYTLGFEDQHVLGDAFLLDTRENGPISPSVEIDNGVRVVTLPRAFVEWLTFRLDQSPTLGERPLNTQPRLGRYQNVKTQPGTSRRVPAIIAPQPLPAAQPSEPTPTEQVTSTVAVSDAVPVAAATEAAPEAVQQVTPTEERAAPEPTESTVTGEPNEAIARVSLDDACRAVVKDAPYPDAAVVDVVSRLERALKGHKVALASPLSARETDRGPRLLRVYIRLEAGESINSLRRISEDLARDVGTESADLHITNVPERHAVGIDLPLKGLTYTVSFPELVAHGSFTAAEEELSLGFCAGVDVTGRPAWTDLLQMPHMLVAGTTGSGKTVFLRNVILTLLMQNPPERMVLRLSSSKPMDFRIFTQVPHAANSPMATDATAALRMAQQLVEEMDRRIQLISDAYCDNLGEYNRENGALALPYIVGIFDEYAEMIASFGDRQERSEFEAAMGRLAQKARAAGVHLIICMQRPDASALKGAIKANILHRFALKLPQQHDSQIILDEGGAETLLGQGDLLYKDASNRVQRLQVPNLDNSYLKNVLRNIGAGGTPATLDTAGMRTCPKCGRSGTIAELFGTRRMRAQRRDGSEVVTARAQSYCKHCRGGVRDAG